MPGDKRIEQMKQIRTFLLYIAFLLPFVAMAGKWTPETLPMVHLEDARRYVCNPDGVLSPVAVDSADVLLARLERDKGIETVVVVVKQLEGDDPYAFGMALGRKYGIGNKEQDTGLIVILAVEDRSYQILTGNGLEGTLPDAICRRIENRVMVPALKRGQWDVAIVETLRSIDRYVREDPSLRAEKEGAEDDMIAGIIAAVLMGGIFLFVVVMLEAGKKRKCPKCGKRQMRVVKTQRVQLNGHRMLAKTWRCKNCGREEVRYEDDPNNSSNMFGGMGIPPIFPGGRGGGGGGGFMGGSFGGGSFGGGGSGGRF